MKRKKNFAAETSHSTLCSKNVSLNIFQQKLLIPQCAAKFLIPQIEEKSSYSIIHSRKFSFRNS